jgi:hypothetical protein
MNPSRTACSALCVTTIKSKVKSRIQTPDLMTFERRNTRGLSLRVIKRYTSTIAVIKQRIVKISQAESELPMKLSVKYLGVLQDSVLTR